jgi:hypothetical protein
LVPLLVGIVVLAACSSTVTAVSGVTEHPRPPSASPQPPSPPPVVAVDTLPAEPAASCGTDGIVRTVEVVGDIAYVAGDFTTVRSAGGAPSARRNIAACDLRTGAVHGWYPSGGADLPVLDLAAVGSWLYAAGEFRQIGGASTQHVARMSIRDAGVDARWDPDPDDAVMLVAPAHGRGVYIGGRFSAIGGDWQPALARLDDTGRVDDAFRPEITYRGGPRAAVYAIAEHGDGALFVGGRFSAINAEPRNSAAAVDIATGQTTTPFAPVLKDTNPEDRTVEVMRILPHDGVVYLCGDYWQIEGSGDARAQRNVGRFDPGTGAADNDWSPTTDGGVQDCALLAGVDVMVIAGHYLIVNGAAHQKLAAVSLRDGSLEPWIEANGTQGVWAVTTTERGAIVLGGNFTRVGTEPAAAFALLTHGGG